MARDGNGLPVLECATALALSCIICSAGMSLANVLGFQGGGITCITTIVVILATLFPTYIGPLAPAGETLALILMQVMFIAATSLFGLFDFPLLLITISFSFAH